MGEDPNDSENGGDGIWLPREFISTRYRVIYPCILYFSVKRGLGAIKNTVLGGVGSVALVSLNRAEALLWKFLAFRLLVFISTLGPAVSSLVGPEGKSWARVNLPLLFCVSRKERVTEVMEVVAKIRGSALCPLFH